MSVFISQSLYLAGLASFAGWKTGVGFFFNRVNNFCLFPFFVGPFVCALRCV